MESRRITVLSAGLGVPSSSRLLADQLAASAERQLAAAGYSAVIEVVELRDLAVDIANNFVTGYAAPKLAEVIAGLKGREVSVLIAQSERSAVRKPSAREWSTLKAEEMSRKPGNQETIDSWLPGLLLHHLFPAPRIAHILASRRAYPGQVLAVTFTNKAAKEMRGRVAELLGELAGGDDQAGSECAHGVSLVVNR